MATHQRMALTKEQALHMLDTSTPREADGWRKGKPVEDPDKLKRWGFITAKPSEYLIHMRRGRIRRRTTGQGASCFKWPWDSIAIIPTTINRLQFTADQVTLEKVGVQVTGLAVYRIVEPELTFRMLNFSYSERASEKLSSILGEMFVGATRRHVANLTVEEVITRRKDAIATELMHEIAPVMRGHGQAEDSSHMGWGVVLDTVEIQDVRVLSETVFRDMQAAFRSQLALRARQAELTSAKEIAAQEATSAREIEEARLAAEAATRELRAKADSQATQIEVTEENRREALRAQAARDQLGREQARTLAELRARAEIEEQRATQDEGARLATLAREQRIAQAERELIETRHENAMRELEYEATRQRHHAHYQAELREVESVANEAIRRRELGLEKLAGEINTALTRVHRDIDNTISEDRIRMALVEHALPAMSQAFAQQFSEVKFTQIGGEAQDPTAMIARSIAQIFELARGLGLRIGSEAPAPVPVIGE